MVTGDLSLSYRLSDQLTTYVSWQHGAKPGISQISGVDSAGNPISRLTKAETSDAYELGLKGNYLNNSLTVNADVFLHDLKNYQQSVYILDEVLTAQNNGVSTYTQITGNAPLVRVQGVELDAAYSGIQNLTLRLAAAYNDARYRESILLAKPVESGNETVKFYDAKGQTVTKAPKFTGNLSAEYRRRIWNEKVFHTNVNYNYTTRFNSDASQSAYSWIDAYGLVDFGIGVGRQDGRFDINLVVKNLLDTDYKYSSTWTSYVPGTPRWYGVTVSGKY